MSARLSRREFLKGVGAVAVGAAAGAGGLQRLFAAGASPTTASPITASPDMAAVRGGEPEALVDAALAAMGGIGRFVRKGQTVTVKPNIGWAVSPEMGANTNPAIVKRLIEHCLNAGARKVYVFDNSCDSWRMAYANSGIERAAKDAGAEVVQGGVESLYQKIEVAGASTLKTAKAHELVLSSDVLINVPVLKHHGGAGMTAALKNYMGMVWDRAYFHARGLDACIAEASLIRKADLTLVDMFRVMKSGGPRGNPSSDRVLLKTLVASTDPVAADAAAAKTLGFEPSRFEYIARAAKLGLGTDRLESLNIKRIVL